MKEIDIIFDDCKLIYSWLSNNIYNFIGDNQVYKSWSIKNEKLIVKNKNQDLVFSREDIIEDFNNNNNSKKISSKELNNFFEIQNWLDTPSNQKAIHYSVEPIIYWDLNMEGLYVGFENSELIIDIEKVKKIYSVTKILKNKINLF
jgi:hypothetical protein